MAKKEQKLDRASLERVARVFGAFSDATRLSILQELMAGPLGVGDLVEAVGGSQGNVSKQLQVLFDAGLLDREKKGNQVIYAISDDIVHELCNLVCDKLNREAEASAGISFQI